MKLLLVNSLCLMKNIKCYHSASSSSSSRVEHTIPLYERKSRAKFRKEKLNKKMKMEILHLNRRNKHFKEYYPLVRNSTSTEDALLLDDFVDRAANLVGHHPYEEIEAHGNYFSFDLKNKNKENIPMENPFPFVKGEIEGAYMNNSHNNKTLKRNIYMLDDVPLTFIHMKKLYYFINKKENKSLVKYMNSSNFLKLCIYMNKKNIRNYTIEEDFLNRVNQTSIDGKGGSLILNESNFIYILEFFHHIGLNCLAFPRRGENNINRSADSSDNDNISNSSPTSGTRWEFNKLRDEYNRVLNNLTNRIVLNEQQIIEILCINDKYLYFNEYIFNYIDDTISVNYHNFTEHDITYICKYLSKTLFRLSLSCNAVTSISSSSSNRNCNSYVVRLIKRYVCKSVIFSDPLSLHHLPHEEKFTQTSISGKHIPSVGASNGKELHNVKKETEKEKEIPGYIHGERCYSNKLKRSIEDVKRSMLQSDMSEKCKEQANFKDLIRKSSFVAVLNKELKKNLHEFKYYNLVDVFEFYTIFNINNKNLIKRFINETDKYINIMKYGYHARALILFSLNRQYLEIENEKTVRRLIRRISYMLNFSWPVEFIIEVIIACSYFSCKDRVFKNLFLYLKNNIKNCIHPTVIINLLQALVPINKINFTVFHQIINYLKKYIKTRNNISYVIYMLKHMSALNYKDMDFFFFFLSFQNVVNQIGQLSNENLVHFFHLIYHYNHFLKDPKSETCLHDVCIKKTNMFAFFTEYVLYLILNRENYYFPFDLSDKRVDTNRGIPHKYNKFLLEQEGMEGEHKNHNNSSGYINCGEILYSHSICKNTESLHITKNEVDTKEVKKIAHNFASDRWKEKANEKKEKPCSTDIIHSGASSSNGQTVINNEIGIANGVVNIPLFITSEITSLNKNIPKLSLPIDTFVYLLKGFINMKLTNLEFLQYAINFVHKNLNLFNENHVIILIQFFSDHMTSYIAYLPDSLIRITYSYLLTIAKNNITNIPDFYLPHCAFSVISFYFVEIVLKNKKSNTDLLENMLVMFCNKMKGGMKVLNEENEKIKKKGSFELLIIISQVMQMLYIKMDKRLPDDLFYFCKYIKKEYHNNDLKENIKNDQTRASQQFIYFFSDLLRKKKIAHFLKYFNSPYLIDIVITRSDNKNAVHTQTRTDGGIKKALFIIDKLESMHLKNIRVTNFFDRYSSIKNKAVVGGNSSQKGKQNTVNTVQEEKEMFVYDNQVSTCLKPYESMREWFLNNCNFSVSYVSMEEWKNEYS
ncbi:conserved Plasmodium protein, unknown function [Plasmodium malariae]|uniref:Uncharacterized protein n=1 Tax=Plasmodium malariae TaxID=5858 RepID=A0A1D3RIS5_PLAMA|nr:conserved Plasmodium protein, unknown function [Plasmodium malariae]SCN45023.1 conserved Plasmodium protein, unknown function [Plasmodium malariae]